MAAETGGRDRSWTGVGVSLILIGLVLASLTVVGADLLWLVAMGDDVRTTGAVPEGVSFASAPSDGWPPVLLVAEVALSLLHELGVGGLMVWHVCSVLATMIIIAVDARRRGASDLAIGFVLGLVFLGGIASFALVRLQTFSLVPFALTLLLVRTQHRRPGRAIWWAPALVAVWGNLHGSVLLGVCVIGAYLLFSRLRQRPGETVAVGVTTLAALFVTPATWRTAEYYVGVMQNEAAASGEGLWGPPRLGEPFDLLLVVAVVVLVALAVRRRLPWWEYVVLAGLGVATVVAARNGIWLLLFLAAPAAASRAQPPARPVSVGRPGRGIVAVGLVALLVSVGLLAHRAQVVTDSDDRLADEVKAAAPGQVVLAPEPAVESLAVRGVKVWLSNPLDAFHPDDQRAYLDFMAGRAGMAVAVASSQAVLVQEGSLADVTMGAASGFEILDLAGSWVLYVRDPLVREP